MAVLTAVFTGAGGQLTPTGYVDAATPAIYVGAAVLVAAVIAALWLPSRSHAREPAARLAAAADSVENEAPEPATQLVSTLMK